MRATGRSWTEAACLLLLLATAFHAATGNAQTGLARIRQQGVLRWAGDIQGGEPYAYQDAQDGHLVGFEVEIATALAQRLGVAAEFVQNDWSTLIPSLERGDFDVAMNGIEVTAARRERVLFSDPYYAFTEVLVVRRDDQRIHGLDDLGGQRVGTLASSMAHDILRERPLQVVLYEGVEEPYIDLEQGRLAGVLLDSVIATRYGLARPSLRKAADVASGVYAIAARRGENDLVEALNHALADMRRDGTLRSILEHWQLWDDRQQSATALPSAQPSPPRVMTVAHLWLFVRGAGVTVAISALAMVLAVGGGLGLSLVRRYGSKAARLAAQVYVEVFRGTPVLLQLYVLYYGLAPILTLNAFAAAVLGLGLNYAAYEAELYRAGLEAVPSGQNEAALSLGMSQRMALRRIVLPQAMRVALPGVANDFIALLKDSSLVSVITVVELTKQMTITAVDVRGWLLPGMLCAALYLALSFPLSRLARRLERQLLPVAQ